MTIVGNGDIASALREGGVDHDDLLFFAAGVSNSGETRQSEYQREADALIDSQLLMIRGPGHLVYFSSLCVFYSNTKYAQHKLWAEDMIQRTFAYYTIVRMGNITWGTNPHTLINTLRGRERLGLPQNIQDVYRYIIDKDEFLHWMRLIPDWPCEMNIPGRRMKVADIYQEFVVKCRQPA